MPKGKLPTKFSSKKTVDEHIRLGNCDTQGIKMTMSEKAKRVYAEKLYQFSHKVPLESTLTKNIVGTNNITMGWAVNETKSRVVFSNRQKDLLMDKFITGKVTENKTEPYVAADEVRNSVQYKSEFISGQRILSVCLAFVKRRGT